MKLAKKILKKIKGKQKRNTGVTLTSLAREYYDGIYKERRARDRFKEELEKKYGHHLTLKQLLSRRGFGRKKQQLTPSMRGVVYERLGEP